MSKIKRYIFNPLTLSYETKRNSVWSGPLKVLVFIVVTLVLSATYFWIYTSVLGFDSPKVALLKKKNAALLSQVEVLNRHLDAHDESLFALQMRDDGIYRSIFGMDAISQEVRNSGFGGVNRYLQYEGAALKRAAQRIDVLTKKAYVQSKSFDEVSMLSKRAGDMASCIPAIPPIVPDKRIYRLSSSFGRRYDPFTGRGKRHTGVDFALKPGNPVYATGDGVVEKIKFELFGYGNQVVINHGFGYKTRYAHMKTIGVVEGMKVKRGECIGLSGNSGRSTGPHLHYEVLYKDNYVNPANYYDLTTTPEEYSTMVQSTADASKKITLHPSHRRKR